MIKKPTNSSAFFLVIVMTFTITPLPTSADQSDFQKGLDYAKSNIVKEKFQQSLSEFKPQEALKTRNSEYTESPPQIGYYSETQSNVYELEKIAKVEVTKDEDYKDEAGSFVPTPGKIVTTTFTSRPIVKIGQNEEFMQKGKLVTDNANNIIGGESNKYINCEKQKMSACKTIQVEKTCNEEVRTIRRICEKIPDIKIVNQLYQEDQSYSGTIPASDRRSGSFILPMSGSITSFSVNFGAWGTQPEAELCVNMGGYSNCRSLPRSATGSYSTNLYNAFVNGNKITISFPYMAKRPWTNSRYDLVITVTKSRKAASTPVWKEACRDV